MTNTTTNTMELNNLAVASNQDVRSAFLLLIDEVKCRYGLTASEREALMQIEVSIRKQDQKCRYGLTALEWEALMQI